MINNNSWEEFISFVLQYIITNLLIMCAIALFVNSQITLSVTVIILSIILFRHNVLMKYNLDKE